ncbi:hypothetical protein [Streptomyces sp. NPDC059874]|uniref:hypothetical protein n=1 Tax=Streptomyces sp. NPDC059874 TaxID=3346983 RepID=UPI0036560691
MIRIRIAPAAAVATRALAAPAAVLAADLAAGAATTNFATDFTVAATVGERPVVAATGDMIL